MSRFVERTLNEETVRATPLANAKVRHYSLAAEGRVSWCGVSWCGVSSEDPPAVMPLSVPHALADLTLKQWLRYYLGLSVVLW